MSELADFQLSRAARRTLLALAPIVLTDEVDELGIREDVVDGVELFLRSIPTPLRLGILAGIATFESSARARPSSFGRSFSRLPARLAEAHFEGYWHSPLGPLKQLARGMKMFLTMSYYEHATKRAQLEYHPEQWIGKVARERLERFAAEIKEHEALVTTPDPIPSGVPRALPAASAPRPQEVARG